MKSYKDPVLKALMRKLKDTDPNPGVVINILVTLGDLAQVSLSTIISHILNNVLYI